MSLCLRGKKLTLMQKIFIILFCIPLFSISQKKPLDHSVYDSWESIGEKYISNDGKIVVYTINVQEGDSRLVIQETNGTILQTIPRGYNATISFDNAVVVCKIKPTFKQTRDAKIAKKKPEDMPKDSLAIFNISTNILEKIERVKSYKLPQESGAWLAYLLEKKLPVKEDKPLADSATQIKELTKQTEKLQLQLDSLKAKLNNALTNGVGLLAPPKETKISTPKKEDDIEEGTELILRNLATGKEQTIRLVQEYLFSKKGGKLIVSTTKKKNDSKINSYVLLFNLDLSYSIFFKNKHNALDTLLTNFVNAKQFAFREFEDRVAFVATFDTSKNEQKDYRIYLINCLSKIDESKTRVYYFTKDSITNESKGIDKEWRINEYSAITFGKSSLNLFFGLSKKLPIKDTLLPDFERVNVDIWHYKDDNLMTVQLKNIDADIKKSHLAILTDIGNDSFYKPAIYQLGNHFRQSLNIPDEGDGRWFYTSSDSGYRVESQWQGFTYKDVFVFDIDNNTSKKIATKIRVNLYPSYTGKYLLMYNEDKKQYSCYNAETNTTTVVAKDIPYPLYDEENDVPDAANNYGVVKWMEEDKAVLIYDKYDMWKVDPMGKEKSVCVTKGRTYKYQYRYLTMDIEEKFIKDGQNMFYSTYHETSKAKSFNKFYNNSRYRLIPFFKNANNLLKAKKSDIICFTEESFQESQKLYSSINTDTIDLTETDGKNSPIEIRFLDKPLTSLNPQQSNYLWGTSELFKWKAYTGKLTEGILYKPENFDSTKKYPMIVYFYERNNQTLHNYRSPSPTASALNIPYFVSNGYVVFVPDIWYSNGKPGKSAYDYIVSGTRALIKKGFIDSTKIGLQGQSWGGYQIAYLITQTNLYKAAWAGAPVANMFSAYGGIRWGSGLNRQFQYERSQSRIGATPWEKPNLYIENSPLFHLPKVKTPLVIMHNDADDAVPWYQGIELFTALRRLNKPVWMLNYNGEAHNLIERKNKKDIQVKQQEFFDYMLKGTPPAKWISEGVPAIMKGRKL